MSVQMALDIGQKTLMTTFLVAGPILLSAIIVGIMVSLFQSMSQINEMTLVFVPKIAVVLLAVLIFLPWIVNALTRFAYELLFVIPNNIL